MGGDRRRGYPWGMRLLLVLALATAARAVEIPAGGLPAGRIASAPLLAVQPAALGSWNVMRAYMLTLGDALPNRAAWQALDADSGRIAAAALLGKLPGTFWADTIALNGVSSARAEQMKAQFLAAHALAAADAARHASDAVAALERGISDGSAGGGDLALLETQLRGLAAFGGAAADRYEEVRAAARQQQERLVAAALAKGGFETRKDDEAPAIEGRLSKPAAHRLGRAATWAGVGLLGASAAAMIHPVPGLEQLPGLLTWGGAASLGAGRLFGAPRAHGADAGASRWTLPDWAKKRLSTFTAIWASAKASAEAERGLEARVGEGRLGAFARWAVTGARTALYWYPLALLGMVGGSAAALPLKLFAAKTAVAAAAEAGPDYAAVAAIPFWSMVNGYAAQMVLAELVLLGVVFNLAKRAGGVWAGALVSLAAMAAFLSFTGYSLALLAPVLGAELVMIALYARTGTLLAPGIARLIFGLTAVESTRMLAYLKVTIPGTLAGLPSWIGLAVAGLLGLFLLKEPLKAQWARVRETGLWWAKPEADGGPKRALPMASLGLLWAVPCYLAMEVAFRLVNWLHPMTEPTPEILRRLMLMPVDVILFNFVIVAALEEWVFRRGVFKPMVDKVKAWKLPQKWWFWPAAIASSLIFSAAHYVDWGAALHAIGIGGGGGDLGSSLAGAYAFTWASFIARAVGGVLLAWLYAASGSLLLPMIAHFGSNTLEALGTRWGPVPFLLSIGAVLALQLWRRTRPPETREP